MDLRDMVNFLFEVGMLKKTPRTGYQFLGSGGESVAEHSFRTAIIGYILSQRHNGADTKKTVLMCLFHDLCEARTGDQNYVNRQYVKVDERKAMEDLTRNLPIKEEIISLIEEFNDGSTIESKISRDADQLDLILELKEQLDLGNRYAKDWIDYAIERLQTDLAKDLAYEILNTDSTEWWFKKKKELWVENNNYKL